MEDNRKQYLEEPEENGLTLRNIFDFVIYNWYWFLLSIIFFTGAGYVVYKVLPKEFASSAMISIDEEYSRGLNTDVTNLTSNRMFRAGNTVDNEIYILKSRSLMSKVVDEQKANIFYHVRAKLRDVEVYRKNAPAELILDSLIRPFTLKLDMEADYYTATIETARKEDEHTIKARYGEIVTDSMAGQFSIVKNEQNFESFLASRDYLKIDVYNAYSTANKYAAEINVVTASRGTSIITLSLRDKVANKTADIINNLIKVYNQDAVEGKRETAEATRQFVDERLKQVDKELQDIDIRIQEFKQKNSSINLEAEYASYQQTISKYNDQIVSTKIQIMQAEEIRRILDETSDSNPKNIRPLPYNIGIQDGPLSSAIAAYNEQVLEWMRYGGSDKQNNPVVRDLTAQIYSMQGSLRQSVENVHKSLLISERQIENLMNEATAKMSNIPSYERESLKSIRDQEIKATLYAFLLEKREEAALKAASTASIARIVDPAMVNVKPVAPRGMMIMLVFVLLGILVPAIVLYLIEQMRVKVARVDEVENAAKNVPIIGSLPSKEYNVKDDIIVAKNSRDIISEAFRMVRTNMDFVMPQGGKVIMVTSSMPGEGKSFVSINMALSLAITGKKVVLVDLDLRKSTLADRISRKKQLRGISNFLAGKEDDMMNLVNKDVNPDLDIVFVGAIPPNPAELLLGNRFEIAVEQLKQHYDYVVIDTPPIGLVTDTIIANKVADLTLFSVRIGHSYKRNLKALEPIREKNILRHLNIIITDTGASKGYSRYGRYASAYGYGYGYGAGYGYGYGKSDKKNVGLKTRMKLLFRKKS